MSSEMRDCLFPILGLVRNMKPTYVFLYSFPGKAYGLRHVDRKNRTYLVMSPYLIKDMRKFYVFNNIIYQKYEPTQSLFYLFVCYQFDIYVYVGSFDEESTEDMEEKKLWAITLDHAYSEIWSLPVIPLHCEGVGQLTELFRFLGLFGKSNEKKWSQIWKLLFLKSLKLPRNCSFLYTKWLLLS